MCVSHWGRLRLGINIDHVATVRNARGGNYPDPLRAAKLAEEAGADGDHRASARGPPATSVTPTLTG